MLDVIESGEELDLFNEHPQKAPIFKKLPFSGK